MSTEDEVREASRQFYNGLNRMMEGDLSVLENVWSHDPSVTAMHPINGREVGWEAVRNSFVPFTEIATDGSVELRDQLVWVLGDVAYEVGTESGQFKLNGRPITVNHRATNIYRREGNGWKMIHHHSDISPAMEDAVGPLRRETRKMQR